MGDESNWNKNAALSSVLLDSSSKIFFIDGCFVLFSMLSFEEKMNEVLLKLFSFESRRLVLILITILFRKELKQRMPW